MGAFSRCNHGVLRRGRQDSKSKRLELWEEGGHEPRNVLEDEEGKKVDVHSQTTEGTNRSYLDFGPV